MKPIVMPALDMIMSAALLAATSFTLKPAVSRNVALSNPALIVATLMIQVPWASIVIVLGHQPRSLAGNQLMGHDRLRLGEGVPPDCPVLCMVAIEAFQRENLLEIPNAGSDGPPGEVQCAVPCCA